MLNTKTEMNYSAGEIQERFEAALKSALNTPHKPLKEKPAVKKTEGKKNPGK